VNLQRKPLCGAIAIGVFITACIALMTHNLDQAMAPWVLILIFTASSIAIYEMAVRMFGDTDTMNPPSVNSHDELSES
jgi:L-asparagine transporter-like permease